MQIPRILSLLSVSTLALMLAAPAVAQDNPSQQPTSKSRTYMGEIMDSACAKAGSHAAMMKQEGTSSAKDCTDKCVQMGSKYVLHNSRRTYQLDDQDKAKEFSGQKVKVTGNYDRATKTLHVERIEGTS